MQNHKLILKDFEAHSQTSECFLEVSVFVLMAISLICPSIQFGPDLRLSFEVLLLPAVSYFCFLLVCEDSSPYLRPSIAHNTQRFLDFIRQDHSLADHFVHPSNWKLLPEIIWP